MGACTPDTSRSRPVGNGTIDDLHKHLQAAADLELWTIPLYLTALYSIKSDSSSVPLPLANSPTSTVTALYASVALQEMYHLQLACNLCGTFGLTPELNWPTYDGQIPYISALPADKVVKLGTATDPELIELVIAVETPDEIETVSEIQYDASGKPCYGSIGNLYSVVMQLVDKFKGDADFGPAHQFSNDLFAAWYPAASLIDATDIDKAIEIIVEQGEGAMGHQAAPLPDVDVPITTRYPHPWLDADKLSHVERFTLIQEHHESVEVWPTPGGAATEQAHLSAVFAKLLDNLRTGWTPNADLQPMMYMRNAMTAVFRAGALPAFAPSGSSGYDDAVAALAPAASATWDDNVEYYFNLTDIGAMKKAPSYARVDLGDESAVRGDSSIPSAVDGGGMPPGNPWPHAMVTSLKNWLKPSSGPQRTVGKQKIY